MHYIICFLHLHLPNWKMFYQFESFDSNRMVSWHVKMYIRVFFGIGMIRVKYHAVLIMCTCTVIEVTVQCVEANCYLQHVFIHESCVLVLVKTYSTPQTASVRKLTQLTASFVDNKTAVYFDKYIYKIYIVITITKIGQHTGRKGWLWL